MAPTYDYELASPTGSCWVAELKQKGERQHSSNSFLAV